MTSRRAQLRFVVTEHWEALEVPDDAAALLHHEAPRPYLLLEVCCSGPSRKHLSLHASPEAASEYHLEQEYAEEWNVDYLVHLDSGQRLLPEVSIRWVAEN